MALLSMLALPSQPAKARAQQPRVPAAHSLVRVEAVTTAGRCISLVTAHNSEGWVCRALSLLYILWRARLALQAGK